MHMFFTVNLFTLCKHTKTGRAVQPCIPACLMVFRLKKSSGNPFEPKGSQDLSIVSAWTPKIGGNRS